MKSVVSNISVLLVSLPTLLFASGCAKAHAETNSGAPPPAKVIADMDVALFSVDHPEQFPLASATAKSAFPELVVTGTVTPDVSRSVPVVSLAAGRITAIYAKVGDNVKKGQKLLSIRSDDVSGAFADYQKAGADEALAQAQLDRSKDLYNHGAISMNDLQVAVNTESKTKLDVKAKAEHLRLLGNDPSHPGAGVEVAAPVTGVITDQQVTMGATVQGAGSTAFTISDLSNVWIICDVYENDLAAIRMGDGAEVRLNAYPGQTFKGKISNIGAILDPNIRTVKVRIEVQNPGLMRLGMFATTTFKGQTQETHSIVPASAVLHLHDRDWVYVPAPNKQFRRVEVVSSKVLPNGMQEIKSGIEPGQQLVTNAVVLEHAIDK
jgi:membrane fusion protein, heavy metal efflux system